MKSEKGKGKKKKNKKENHNDWKRQAKYPLPRHLFCFFISKGRCTKKFSKRGYDMFRQGHEHISKDGTNTTSRHYLRCAVAEQLAPGGGPHIVHQHAWMLAIFRRRWLLWDWDHVTRHGVFRVPLAQAGGTWSAPCLGDCVYPREGGVFVLPLNEDG